MKKFLVIFILSLSSFSSFGQKKIDLIPNPKPFSVFKKIFENEDFENGSIVKVIEGGHRTGSFAGRSEFMIFVGESGLIQISVRSSIYINGRIEEQYQEPGTLVNFKFINKGGAYDTKILSADWEGWHAKVNLYLTNDKQKDEIYIEIVGETNWKHFTRLEVNELQFQQLRNMLSTNKPTAANIAKEKELISRFFLNQLDSVSYAAGVSVAQNFKSQQIILNPAMLAKGFKAATKGSNLVITEQESQKIVQNFMENNQNTQSTKLSKQFQLNKEEGEKFLLENKSKDSIILMPSGLQYKIIKLGSGLKPLVTEKVKVNYFGTTIDGKVFDSSTQRGGPISFTVNEVINGWSEALQLMPVGSKFKLFIPQNLAYGARGLDQLIKPYSALIFEVELLGIER